MVTHAMINSEMADYYLYYYGGRFDVAANPSPRLIC